MNIKDLNVGDILEWYSYGNSSELVMVVSVFKSERMSSTTAVKVKVISSTREDRIGCVKTFTHKTLNRHRTVKYIA